MVDRLAYLVDAERIGDRRARTLAGRLTVDKSLLDAAPKKSAE